eukprot:6202476-Pleurochrysis_carterae.AAC.2
MTSRRDIPCNWKHLPDMPPSEKKSLLKRMLQCETKVAIVASVHLGRIEPGDANCFRARIVYRWVFDAHDVVLGNMNSLWQHMIGGVELDTGRPKQRAHLVGPPGWLDAQTHRCAQRPNGSYLPAVVTPKVARWKGDSTVVHPKGYDLVVAKAPFVLELAPQQQGPKWTPCKLPRNLMKSSGWPSDHVPIAAVVRSTLHPWLPPLAVASWCCADCLYNARFHHHSDVGFGWQPEADRQKAIEKQVVSLLEVSDVLGLQQVPSSLVPRLAAHGVHRKCEVQWKAAPSDWDGVWYEKVAGQHGCSRQPGAAAALSQLPPVPHIMMFAKHSVLAHPPVEAGSSTVTPTDAASCEASQEPLQVADSLSESLSTSKIDDGVPLLAKEDAPDTWEALE